MPPVAEWIRSSGWRQGCVVRREDTQSLLSESIDYVSSIEGRSKRLVVVTQDCDLVRDSSIEPFVELVLCGEIEELQPLYQNGRNPRMLHIRPVGTEKSLPVFELSIHDRFRVPKEAFRTLDIDKSTRLNTQDVRLLSRWIAKRYTRPAFPDAFNLRLGSVDAQLERLFKSGDALAVTGIFLDVADEEFSPSEPYEIGVRVTAKAESWENDELRGALERFEERLSSILENCAGIAILNDDIHVLPEDDLTLEELLRFKRLDKDYRSLPSREGVDQPVDTGGEV